jgi:hypothetical protein
MKRGRAKVAGSWGIQKITGPFQSFRKKKAVPGLPSMEGALLLYGYFYYDKHSFDLEAL